jgi:hypothetical protein
VRSDAVPSDELLALRRRVEELQNALDQVAAHGPAGIEDLAHGRDLFAIGFSVERWSRVENVFGRVELSWDHIFASVAPSLIETSETYDIVREFNRLVEGVRAEREVP